MATLQGTFWAVGDHGSPQADAAAVGKAISAQMAGKTNPVLVHLGDDYESSSMTGTHGMNAWTGNDFFTTSNIKKANVVFIPGNHDNGPAAIGANNTTDPSGRQFIQYVTGSLTKVNGGWVDSTATTYPNTDDYLDLFGYRLHFINDCGVLNSAAGAGSATPGWPQPNVGTMPATTSSYFTRVTRLRNAWAPGLKNILCYHHSRFSRYGIHFDNKNLQLLFDEYMGHNDNSGAHGVLAISGHDHCMSLNKPRFSFTDYTGKAYTMPSTYPGLTTAVIGAGGVGHDTGTATSSQSVLTAADVQFANIMSTSAGSGFVRIDLYDTQIVLTYYDSGGSVMGSSSVASGAASTTIQVGSTPPQAPGTPSVAISGTAQVGNTLTAAVTLNAISPGSPTPTPTYQWKRDGTAISGATAQTYLLVTADATHNITCTVLETNATGSASGTSNTIGPIAAVGSAPTVGTPTPSLSTNTPTQGIPITCSQGTWNNSPTSYSYAFKTRTATGTVATVQSGASSQYVPVAGDLGKTIFCTVTATNATGPGTFTTPDTTSPVIAPPSGTTVTDTFTRNTTASIGTADSGQSGVIDQGTASQFNCNGTQLVISAIAGNAPIFHYAGFNQADAEVVIRYSFDSAATGATQSIALALRLQDAQNYDRAVITQTLGGNTNVVIEKQIAGANTLIAPASGVHSLTAQTAGTVYWAKFRALGTSYQFRVWADGTPEPTTWDLAGVDSTYGTASGGVVSGSVGGRLQALAGNTNLSPYRIYDFSAVVPGTSGSVTFQYSLDGATWLNTGNGGQDLHEALSGLSVGTHSFQVRAVDTLAGAGPPAMYAWQVNPTTLAAPVIASAVDGAGVTLNPGGHTTNPNATFTVTTDAGTNLQVSVDGGAYQTITSPWTLSALGVGSHNVSFQETDNVGNVSTATTFAWTVDQLPTGGPGSGTYTKQVTLKGTAGASVNNQILVRATDLNASPLQTQVQRNVVVQLPLGVQPPAVSIIAPGDGSTVFSTTIPVTVQATSVGSTISSVTLTTDGVTFVNCSQVDAQTWVGSITVPPDITTSITATATDAVGNSSADVATITETSTPGPGPDSGGGGPAIISNAPKAEFRVVIMDHNENDVGQIKPEQLQFSMILNNIGTVSWNMNRKFDPMANIAMLDPDLHDWRLEMNKVPIMAGILNPNGLQMSASTTTMQVSGQTWEGYLAQSYMPYDPTQDVTTQNLTYVNKDIFAVVRSLVNYVLGGPFSIPIAYDLRNSGTLITQQFLASDVQDLLTIITDLSNQINGFDFEITPDCILKMYAPQKGTHSQLVLRQDRNIVDVNYTNPGRKANRVLAIGSGSGNTSVVRTVDDVADQQRTGRLVTEVVQFNNITSVAQVAALAKAEKNLAVLPQRQISVDVRPSTGENPLLLCVPGDWARVQYDFGYEAIDDFYRCTQIDGKPTDQGDTILTYTFAPNTINTGD